MADDYRPNPPDGIYDERFYAICLAQCIEGDTITNWDNNESRFIKGTTIYPYLKEWNSFRYGNGWRLTFMYFTVNEPKNGFRLTEQIGTLKNAPRWIYNSSYKPIPFSNDENVRLNNLYGLPSLSWLFVKRDIHNRPYDWAYNWLKNSHTYMIFFSISELKKEYDSQSLNNVNIFDYIDIMNNYNNLSILSSKMTLTISHNLYIYAGSEKEGYGESWCKNVSGVDFIFKIDANNNNGIYSYNGYTPICIKNYYSGAFIYSHIYLASVISQQSYKTLTNYAWNFMDKAVSTFSDASDDNFNKLLRIAKSANYCH